jgi:four helix bundle protein
MKGGYSRAKESGLRPKGWSRVQAQRDQAAVRRVRTICDVTSRRACRHSTASYVQHLWTAHASGAELQTQLLVGTRIEIVSEAEASTLIADAEEVGRMIHGLVAALERAR